MIFLQGIILQLVKSLNKPVAYFLHGGCLLFATELQKLVGGSLRYLSEEAHVVLDINNKLYDATGNVTNLYKDSKYITEEELRKRHKIMQELKMTC